MPALETGGTLKGIEGAVDFEGSKFVGGKFEFLALREFWRIENAAPGYVAPSGNADADLASFGHVQERQRALCLEHGEHSGRQEQYGKSVIEASMGLPRRE